MYEMTKLKTIHSLTRDSDWPVKMEKFEAESSKHNA